MRNDLMLILTIISIFIAYKSLKQGKNEIVKL